MAINPVLAQDSTSGDLFPCPQGGEAFVLKRDAIDFEVTLPRGGKLKGRGCFYLSSIRIVFVALERSSRADFKSFEIPLTALRQQKFEQPIFGANYLSGIAFPLDGDPNGLLAGGAKFSLTFNHGGCGTFLPLFFQLLAERQQPVSSPGVTQAAQDGRLDQVAFVDPSDPSTLYLSQPTATPNSQQQTQFQAFEQESGSAPPRQEGQQNCSIS
mmetsp:Transcript_12537/g.24180  ORF Transcript_12537/g.24180 Transcript_12537/m.24180 type:complete len:213 (+) Transcript_12537:87-725(+)